MSRGGRAQSRHHTPLWRSLLLVLSCCQPRQGAAQLVSGGRPQRRLPDAAVPINLYEVLGPDAFARGVIWQPMTCYAPVSQRMDDPSEANLKKLEAMMEQDLIAALSEATGIPSEKLNRDSSFPGVYGIPGLDQSKLEHQSDYRKEVMRNASSDPRYWQWLQLQSRVVNRYTVMNKDPASGMYPMGCLNDTIAALVGKVRPLPGVDCANASSISDEMGLFLDPNIQIATVLQRVLHDPGWCSVHSEYAPFAKWVKQERIMKRQLAGSGEQRFRFDNRHKDRLVFLFDMMYETSHAFKKQHWLGAVVQQNPFDMYVITDLIYRLKPDLIVETGTANGGSALMWASMLELVRPGTGRVITIDVNEPGADGWAGSNTKDPTEDPLWDKYVTFLKGSSVGEELLSVVRKAAEGAKTVLVLLDSDHTQEHVLLEARNYCPLVTPGSYCLVEDTKLSRFSTIDGPTPAIRRFLAANTDFVVDRKREPFYTQHVGGYLKRLPSGVKRGPGGKAVLAGSDANADEARRASAVRRLTAAEGAADGGSAAVAVGAARGGGGGGGGRRLLPDAVVPVNLYELLGPTAYARGVTWQPWLCYAPTKQRMDDPSAENLQKLDSMMEQELLATLSEHTGVPVNLLNRTSSFPLAYGVPNLLQPQIETSWGNAYHRTALRNVSSDPRYWAWLRSLSLVAMRYTVVGKNASTNAFQVACPSEATKALIGKNLEPVPGVDCANASSILSASGLFPEGHLRLDTILQRVLRDPGWCAAHSAYEPYGLWLKRERIMKKPKGDEMRFNLPNAHQDRVAFLFDLLYEAEMAFKHQYWLGAVAQQNPFDMYALMDIIHMAEPDLIIETGTANGGSALMWASMLELTRPGSGKVITIDLVKPDEAHWAGDGEKTADPTTHPLWAKYVTFIQGSSSDGKVLERVRSEAAAAETVLVLLDSNHETPHVADELVNLCPLVTNGSYCVVQDTKLSRFSVFGGPRPALTEFLAAPNNKAKWLVDRDREPFYTHHVGGYLQRVAP